jgi:hypothetical protein
MGPSATFLYGIGIDILFLNSLDLLFFLFIFYFFKTPFPLFFKLHFFIWIDIYKLKMKNSFFKFRNLKFLFIFHFFRLKILAFIFCFLPNLHIKKL